MKKNQCLKYSYAFVFLFSYLFYNSQIQISSEVHKISTLFCFLLFVLWMLNSKIKIKQLILYFIIVVIGFISYLITNMSIFILILFAIIMYDEKDSKQLAKEFLILRVVSLSVLFLGVISGAVSNVQVDVYKSGIHVLKSTLGFNHPNQFGQAASIIILLLILLYRNSFCIYIVSSILIFLLYLISGSRTSVICCILFLVYSIITKNKKWKYKISKCICYNRWLFVGGILFISLGLSILMTKLTGTPLKYLYKFNGLLGSRYSFSSAVLNNYDITLFGNTFDFSYLEKIYGNYAVDNSYINIMYGFGSISLAILVLFSVNAIRRLIENDMDNYAFLILILLLLSCFENILFNPSINFAIFLLGSGKYNFNFRERKKMVIK